MSSPEIQFPLTAKKPPKLMIAPTLLMAMGVMVLGVMAWSALAGGLKGLDLQTTIAAYAMMGIAAIVFAIGLVWLLSLARFRLTFPDRDHLELRTLTRSTSCGILDVTASTTTAPAGTLLVLKDETGKSLGYLESTARNWDECVAVIRDARSREKKLEWYQRMVSTTWYCPFLDDGVCVKHVDGEDMFFVFVADDPDVAMTLANEPDSVLACTIKQLVEFVDLATDDWVIMFNVNHGEERHSMEAYGWIEVCETLGL